MNCAASVELLERTIGDTLDAAEAGLAPADHAAARGRLHAHLATCPACAAVRDEIRSAAERLGAAMTADARLEASADDALVGAVMARLPEMPVVPGRVRYHRYRRWGVRAAVVLVSLSAGYAGWSMRPSGPRFADVTESAGIANVDHTGLPHRKDWMVETVGHGAAVLDMDGDGDLDLFVPDGNRLAAADRVSGTWRLYRNDGGLRFTDVTAGSGLDVDAWGGGAVAGDVDGDGRPDLFVPCFGRDHLFRNLGDGRFEDVTAAAGVAGRDEEWGTTASLGDVDGDGDLDLYVANYADMRRYLTEAPRARDCTWRSMPVACGPTPLDPQQDRLFLNRGDGTFEDATADRLPKIRRYSFQSVLLDLDRDGALDVFVACDAQPNLLLRNDGTGRFTDVAGQTGAATNGAGQSQAGMGVAAGDADGDGRIDLFHTNFSHEPNCLRVAAPGARFAFRDATAAAGLEAPSRMTLGWGAAFVDLDCDGDHDLVYANGHLYPGVEKVVPETTYAQPVAVFENDGHGRFVERTATAGDAAARRVHRGLVAADFDDDGATDLFLTVLNDRAVLLRNDARGVGRSARFLLRARGGRVEAGGACLIADVEDVPGRTQVVRDLALGSSFGGGEDPRLVVGLGRSGRVKAVSVRWPGAGPDAAPVLPPEGEERFAHGATYEVVQGTPRARRVR